MKTSRFWNWRHFFSLIFALAWGGSMGAPSAFALETINLYFMNPDHTHLKAEVRQIPEPERVAESARAVVDALLAGPGETLAPTLPEGLILRTLFVTQRKTAYVDFEKGPDVRMERGVLPEWLAVYSIVNSLTLNIPELEYVKILFNGREAMTFSGHIDLTEPFKANMLLIR